MSSNWWNDSSDNSWCSSQ